MTPLFKHSISALLVASSLVVSQTSLARDYSFTDAHLHYVDFFQQTDGMANLFTEMDKANIQQTMISGIPVAKKWDEDEPKQPRYYAGDDGDVYWYSATDYILAEAIQKLSAEQQARLHPFLSGFNPSDKNAAQHIRNLLDAHPNFWQGIGEVFLRHDDVTALTLGRTPRANNEAMHKVYRVAAEYDLPVLLHSNITSKREPEPIYLSELEQVLQDHPRVRFIWAHAGTSLEIHRRQNELEFLPEAMSKLLAKYPNLTLDLSWSMLDPYLLDQTTGLANPVWVKLVEQYPQRFVIGSDLVGKFGSLEKNMHSFTPFLDALTDETAQLVASDNFLNLLPKRERVIETTE